MAVHQTLIAKIQNTNFFVSDSNHFTGKAFGFINQIFVNIGIWQHTAINIVVSLAAFVFAAAFADLAPEITTEFVITFV